MSFSTLAVSLAGPTWAAAGEAQTQVKRRARRAPDKSAGCSPPRPQPPPDCSAFQPPASCPPPPPSPPPPPPHLHPHTHAHTPSTGAHRGRQGQRPRADLGVHLFHFEREVGGAGHRARRVGALGQRDLGGGAGRGWRGWADEPPLPCAALAAAVASGRRLQTTGQPALPPTSPPARAPCSAAAAGSRRRARGRGASRRGGRAPCAAAPRATSWPVRGRVCRGAQGQGAGGGRHPGGAASCEGRAAAPPGQYAGLGFTAPTPAHQPTAPPGRRSPRRPSSTASPRRARRPARRARRGAAGRPRRGRLRGRGPESGGRQIRAREGGNGMAPAQSGRGWMVEGRGGRADPGSPRPRAPAAPSPCGAAATAGTPRRRSGGGGEGEGCMGHARPRTAGSATDCTAAGRARGGRGAGAGAGARARHPVCAQRCGRPRRGAGARLGGAVEVAPHALGEAPAAAAADAADGMGASGQRRARPPRPVWGLQQRRGRSGRPERAAGGRQDQDEEEGVAEHCESMIGVGRGVRDGNGDASGSNCASALRDGRGEGRETASGQDARRAGVPRPAVVAGVHAPPAARARAPPSRQGGASAGLLTTSSPRGRACRAQAQVGRKEGPVPGAGSRNAKAHAAAEG
jgi:hypothetical protein